MKQLRIAMLAPPWLKIPPKGYGGIENVIAGLVPELMRLGHKVELFATGDTTLECSKLHSLYKEGQYRYIHKPQFESTPISIAHIHYALSTIRQAGNFDIIHDHNSFAGPAILANTQEAIPPALHTLHGPPFSSNETKGSGVPDNIPMWRQLGHADTLHFVGISNAAVKNAPQELKHLILPSVYNAIDVSQFPFVTQKKDYVITLARFNPDKGQHIAIQIAQELGLRLKMAGVVCNLASHKQVMMEIGNPLSSYRSSPDFRYYSDYIFPHLMNRKIEHVGEVGGKRKLEFISRAKALLFPIQWDEPFGMAVIEALACGTPVVAMARGAMPEIIQHGYNGFLANNVTEFKHYVQQIHTILPENCRKSVEQTFSAHTMAKAYVDRYQTIINLHQ